MINQGELADIKLHTPKGPIEIYDVTYAHIDLDKQEIAIVGNQIICSQDIAQELDQIREEIDREDANMVFATECLGADGVVYEKFGYNETFGYNQDDMSIKGFGD